MNPVRVMQMMEEAPLSEAARQAALVMELVTTSSVELRSDSCRRWTLAAQPS